MHNEPACGASMASLEPIDSNEVRGWSMRSGRSSQLAAGRRRTTGKKSTHVLNLNVKCPSVNVVLKRTYTVVGSNVFPSFLLLYMSVPIKRCISQSAETNVALPKED